MLSPTTIVSVMFDASKSGIGFTCTKRLSSASGQTPDPAVTEKAESEFGETMMVLPVDPGAPRKKLGCRWHLV